MNWKEAVSSGTLFVMLVALVASTAMRLGQPSSTKIVLMDAETPVGDGPAALKRELRAAPMISLAFVGDIMQHRAQANDDFEACYRDLQPLISSADLAVGNLEFPVDPSRPVGPLLDSVQFNGSPAHIAALAAAGFDVLSTANNHSFDLGLSGLRATLRQLEEHGIAPVGNPLDDTLHQPVVVTCRGIRVGFFAYTFRPNSYSGADAETHYWDRAWPIHELNFFDWRDEYRAEGLDLWNQHVKTARGDGVDWLIALVHWGREWHFRPTEDQQAAGRAMIDLGFDMVVGSHGHVINPIEVYRQRLIAHSLGNLISDFQPLAARVGALLQVELGRNAHGDLIITEFRAVPVITERRGHRVRPLQVDRAEDDQAWELAQRVLGPACRSTP